MQLALLEYSPHFLVGSCKRNVVNLYRQRIDRESDIMVSWCGNFKAASPPVFCLSFFLASQVSPRGKSGGFVIVEE